MHSRVHFHSPLVTREASPMCVPKALPETSNNDLAYKMCKCVCHHEFPTVHSSYSRLQIWTPKFFYFETRAHFGAY